MSILHVSLVNAVLQATVSASYLANCHNMGDFSNFVNDSRLPAAQHAWLNITEAPVLSV